MGDPRIRFSAEPRVDLGTASVAILGCGSVGSFAAWCLASAGVGRLVLADRDELAVENLRRHICSAETIGLPKPAAVARFLGGRFRDIFARPRCFCFLEHPDRLRQLLRRTDLALVAVDDEAPKHLIDSMCREMGLPAIFAGVYGGGWAAEVILTDPASDTPC